MKRLSIVIVTYHSEKDIYDCLRTIYQYCDIPHEKLEIIIVDNSPNPDAMFAQIRLLYGNQVKLIHNTHNGGYGQGNNMGIRQATAPVILIMNPDVRLCQPIIKTALTAFEKDSRLCMYGIKQMLSSTIKSPLSFDCSRQMNGYLIPFVASLCNKFDIYLSQSMYFAGSCFFIKKSKFVDIGLFDENIFMYGEEDDIHYRLKKQFGSHFKYNPSLRYIHQTLERQMSLNTEQKMISSIVALNTKKGISVKSTYCNFVRYYRVRLFATYIKKILGNDTSSQSRIDILKDIIRYCRSVKSI